jgi:hypothetical protein
MQLCSFGNNAAIDPGVSAARTNAKFLKWCRRGLNNNTLFAVFTEDFLVFLRKTARFVFRSSRSVGMVRTQLYLSCSQLGRFTNS